MTEILIYYCESVCMQASWQLKSNTPAPKYYKSFAIMLHFWFDISISQLQKLQIRYNILISDFYIVTSTTGLQAFINMNIPRISLVVTASLKLLHLITFLALIE